jgi:hypothetical protein
VDLTEVDNALQHVRAGSRIGIRRFLLLLADARALTAPDYAASLPHRTAATMTGRPTSAAIRYCFWTFATCAPA